MNQSEYKTFLDSMISPRPYHIFPPYLIQLQEGFFAPKLFY